jgi:hypothetical protein
MKIKSKNIITVLILILMFTAMSFTIYKASNSYSSSNASINQNNTQPPEMPGNNTATATTSNTSELGIKYYLLFTIEGLIISILIMYLILSNFNKQSLKETFAEKDKIIIMLLSTIIITTGILFTDKLITSNLTTKNNSDNKMNGGVSTTQNITYSGNTEINENKTISSGDYSSNTTDENAILVNGDIESTLSNINVNKTGDSTGGDSTSFYGMNSAILAKSGSTLTIKNATINTDATGANGVFCYGGSTTTNNTSNDGTTINISDSKITTTKDNSGGIMTTGGGTMNANNLTVTTAGTSSAAIRTDRGGGTVNVNGGTYKTTGQGSPTIYSTANITVKNAELIATSSEGAIIEGKNSITLDNVNLTDTNNKLNGQSTTYKNIFIYQSMSGDAANGTSEFTATNSTITTNKGDTIYVTNTKTKIYLENNTFINNDETGNFLRVQSDSWGNSGSNGGDVSLTLTKQQVTGNIVVDSISTLDMTMESSSYEGTINENNTAKSISIKLDKTSKIKLTGDSYITSLDNSDATNSNIDFNGYKLYVNGQSIN